MPVAIRIARFASSAVAVGCLGAVLMPQCAAGATPRRFDASIAAGSSSSVAACSASFDPDTSDVTPVVTTKTAAASDVAYRFTFLDGAGKVVATRDFTVARGTTGAAPFRVASPFSGVTCGIAPTEATASGAATGGGPGVGVLAAGAAALGILVATTSRGSSFGSTPPPPAPATAATIMPTTVPTLAPTPTAVSTATPTVAPTATASATPVASATPTAVPTGSPTAAPSATPTATATPTAVPMPTATPGGAQQPTLMPSSLSFTASGQTNRTIASESGYSGAFSVTNPNACPNVATIASSSPAFTVTAQGAGSCTFTIADAGGRSATLTVGVTTTGGTINGVRRGIAPIGTPRHTP